MNMFRGCPYIKYVNMSRVLNFGRTTFVKDVSHFWVKTTSDVIYVVSQVNKQTAVQVKKISNIYFSMSETYNTDLPVLFSW